MRLSSYLMRRRKRSVYLSASVPRCANYIYRYHWWEMSHTIGALDVHCIVVPMAWSPLLCATATADLGDSFRQHGGRQLQQLRGCIVLVPTASPPLCRDQGRRVKGIITWHILRSPLAWSHRDRRCARLWVPPGQCMYICTLSLNFVLLMLEVVTCRTFNDF